MQKFNFSAAQSFVRNPHFYREDCDDDLSWDAEFQSITHTFPLELGGRNILQSMYIQ